MNGMKYVIIGNSAAGIGAVEGIRQVDKQSEITIISNEPHHTYSRPLISYLLLGKVTEDTMKYRDSDFYSENNCILMAGVNVKKIEEKNVLLENGKAIPYDKLLVSTGSTAFVPPFEGLDSVKNKFTFMTLNDAKQLESVINTDSNVLIIGAGLIGLKCAEGIKDRVSQVTIVDLAPKILSSILDDDSAEIMQNHLQSVGLKFLLSDGVSKFEGNTAVLNSGKKFDFDILVLAVGVRPNTSLLEGVADIDKGIAVNEKSETSAKNIYAAGDCTLSLDVSDNQKKIMALLPNAYMQGECAGINMAGGEKTFDKAIPMNAIGFCRKHIVTAGNYTGEKFTKKTDDEYKCLYYSNNKLNGFIMVGDIEKAGIYTNLIREQTPLNTIDFDFICENPSLMAFTTEDRALI